MGAGWSGGKADKRRDLSAGVRLAGVRARVVPLRSDPREARLAKPGRGKEGREVEA